MRKIRWPPENNVHIVWFREASLKGDRRVRSEFSEWSGKMHLEQRGSEQN